MREDPAHVGSSIPRQVDLRKLVRMRQWTSQLAAFLCGFAWVPALTCLNGELWPGNISQASPFLSCFWSKCFTMVTERKLMVWFEGWETSRETLVYLDKVTLQSERERPHSCSSGRLWSHLNASLWVQFIFSRTGLKSPLSQMIMSGVVAQRCLLENHSLAQVIV